jgi:hypothetical protein
MKPVDATTATPVVLMTEIFPSEHNNTGATAQTAALSKQGIGLVAAIPAPAVILITLLGC